MLVMCFKRWRDHNWASTGIKNLHNKVIGMTLQQSAIELRALGEEEFDKDVLPS
jgi:hypothetical protein